MHLYPFVPAEAGTQSQEDWIPAFAGRSVVPSEHRYVKFNSPFVPRPLWSRLKEGRAAVMATIYTSCPNTGHEISTGIETDADSFLGLQDFISSVLCPHCGERHEWSKRNAFLRESPRKHPPDRTRER